MWKREFLVFSMVLLCLGLCSFGSCGSASAESKTEIMSETKVLIAYFSWSGNTKAAAEKIQKYTEGVLFELQPSKAYPTDYASCLERAKAECADGVQAELVALPENLEQYDVIFVGSPTWYGVIAPPALTFFANPVLKGKTVIPFFTHGGGGSDGCAKQARKVCQDSVLPAIGGFPGNRVRNSDLVENWLKEFVTVQK